LKTRSLVFWVGLIIFCYSLVDISELVAAFTVGLLQVASKSTLLTAFTLRIPVIAKSIVLVVVGMAMMRSESKSAEVKAKAEGDSQGGVMKPPRAK